MFFPFLDHSLTNTSYRVEPDQEFVRRVYLELTNKRIEPPIVPYMDSYCLVAGTDFRSGFLAGLEHSKVAVLFISIQALEKMKNAAKELDNLLLEVGGTNNYVFVFNSTQQWQHAIRLEQEGNLSILPVFIKQTTQTQFSNRTYNVDLPLNAFFDSCPRLPNEPHYDNSCPGAVSIAETFQNIRRFQGIGVGKNTESDVTL